MEKFIKTYIKRCDSCQRMKTDSQKAAGLLQPLELPEDRWESISMDFIMNLPESNRFNAITVFVDRLMKRAHFAASHTTDDALETAHVFLREIFRQRGLLK